MQRDSVDFGGHGRSALASGRVRNDEMHMPSYPVLIVGAGPTGLYLALELKRRGIEVRLIDHSEAPVGISRATVIKSRTLEIFERTGLTQRLVERGTHLRGIKFIWKGREMGAFKWDQIDSPFPFHCSIGQEFTEQFLQETLHGHGAEIERGVDLCDLQNCGTHVAATLRTREGELREQLFSWVVGSDGCHSRVRQLLGDPMLGVSNVAVRGVVDAVLEGWTFPQDLIIGQLEPPCLNPIAIQDGQHRVYFRKPEDESRDLLDILNENLDALCPGAKMKNPGEVGLFHINSKLARDYRIGRVFLAGDAAHLSSPIEGHGLNFGIQDGHNLAWKLAMVIQGHAREEILDTYHEERRPADQEGVESGKRTEIREDERLDSEELPPSTIEMLEYLESSEGQQAAAESDAEVSLAYGTSSLIEDYLQQGADPLQRVGDIAGLLTVEGRRRLFELLNETDFLLLHLLKEGENRLSDFLQNTSDCLPKEWFRYLQVVPLDQGTPSTSKVLDPEGKLAHRLGGDFPGEF